MSVPSSFDNTNIPRRARQSGAATWGDPGQRSQRIRPTRTTTFQFPNVDDTANVRPLSTAPQNPVIQAPLAQWTPFEITYQALDGQNQARTAITAEPMVMPGGLHGPFRVSHHGHARYHMNGHMESAANVTTWDYGLPQARSEAFAPSRRLESVPTGPPSTFGFDEFEFSSGGSFPCTPARTFPAGDGNGRQAASGWFHLRVGASRANHPDPDDESVHDPNPEVATRARYRMGRDLNVRYENLLQDLLHLARYDAQAMPHFDGQSTLDRMVRTRFNNMQEHGSSRATVEFYIQNADRADQGVADAERDNRNAQPREQGTGNHSEDVQNRATEAGSHAYYTPRQSERVTTFADSTGPVLGTRPVGPPVDRSRGTGDQVMSGRGAVQGERGGNSR